MAVEELQDLPEAIPLRRVSPAWRVLALLAFLGILGLAVVVVILSIALWHHGRRPTPVGPFPPRVTWGGLRRSPER